MKPESEYDCINRFTGNCQRNCKKDRGNYNCPSYYPAHILATGEALVEPKMRADEIKWRLQCLE